MEHYTIISASGWKEDIFKQVLLRNGYVNGYNDIAANCIISSTKFIFIYYLTVKDSSLTKKNTQIKKDYLILRNNFNEINANYR